MLMSVVARLTDRRPDSKAERKAERAQRVAREALRARITVAVAAVAVVLSALALVLRWVESGTQIAIALGAVYAMLALFQVALRTFLLQTAQETIVDKTEEAANTLDEIKRTAEQELKAEERQNRNLELLFTALRDFNIIQAESLDMLLEARPTTTYYLQRQVSAIVAILHGSWDRSESLQPEQLWMEYAELLKRLKPEEQFRSTVYVPTDPEPLFKDASFQRYVKEIYKAVRSQKVDVVRRLFVLEDETWPLTREALPTVLIDHLRYLQRVEHETSSLTARVTINEHAKMKFHGHPDFMVWGDGLAIESNLTGKDGLVVTARFFFAGTHDEEIRRRQDQFDEVFGDETETMSLEQLLGPLDSPTRSRAGSRRRRKTTR